VGPGDLRKSLMVQAIKQVILPQAGFGVLVFGYGSRGHWRGPRGLHLVVGRVWVWIGLQVSDFEFEVRSVQQLVQ
jgi:hypothetical protein